MTRVFWIVCAMALGGCAPPGTNAPGAISTAPPAVDLLAKISALTVLDLKNADAIAVAYKDNVSHACFPPLIAWIQSIPGTTATTTVSGAVSAFELARVKRLGLTGGIPDAVKIGCGGLLIDEQTLLLKLGAMAATVVPLP